VLNPQLIEDGARRFGSQCIVLSIDARRVNAPDEPPARRSSPIPVAIRVPTGLDAIEWARRGVELGAGEIVINSMDEDGVGGGYDIDLLRAITEAVDVPVIASGGVGSPEHMYAGLVEGRADAVLAASIFHFGAYTIRDVKQYLAERGVPVRL
jgi:imidazole glycerol phosphate synthase subunit hisF (EC 4.1.3.-)